MKFYASTDTTITSSDRYIGEQRLSVVPGLGYRACDWSGTFPTDIPAGTYYVGWIIDTGNEVEESDENNNTAYKDGSQLTVNARVPNVMGMTESQATAAIVSAGLVVGTKTSQCSNTVPAGSVITQSPTVGTPASPGSAVNLTLSSGPCMVTVPNVVGMTESQGVSAITSAGLTAGTKWYGQSDTVPAGTVKGQSPAAGTSATFGSAVEITISTGPSAAPQVTVPNVVGLAQSAAQSAITTVGLAVGAATQAASDGVAKGSVISQSPPAGTSVAKGSAVNLVISSGPAGGTATGNIIWVSDGHQTIAGATTPDDQGWVDLLRAQGYSVDYQPPAGLGAGYWQILDATKLAALDAADLIIVSHDTNTGAVCQ